MIFLVDISDSQKQLSDSPQATKTSYLSFHNFSVSILSSSGH